MTGKGNVQERQSPIAGLFSSGLWTVPVSMGAVAWAARDSILNLISKFHTFCNCSIWQLKTSFMFIFYSVNFRLTCISAEAPTTETPATAAPIPGKISLQISNCL